MTHHVLEIVQLILQIILVQIPSEVARESGRMSPANPI